MERRKIMKMQLNEKSLEYKARNTNIQKNVVKNMLLKIVIEYVILSY